jgi:signal transduction histidine kinase
MPPFGTRRFDQCMALLVIALSVAIAFVRATPPTTTDLLLLALAASPWVATAAGWCWRPAVFAVTTLTAVWALMAVTPAHADPTPLLFLLLVVRLGWDARPRTSIPVLAASCGVIVYWGVVSEFDAVFIWCVGLSMGWAFANASRCQVDALERLRAAQETLADRAAADERRRVAREVHDVIAHTLAVTMLHLTGARLALAEGDADEALRGLTDAERLGRDSLAGLRRSVGLLTTDESATAPPAPGVDDLQQLVAQYVAAGAQVDYHVTGAPCALPPEVGLAVYRVAQESLANAARHAPGARVTVALDVRGPVRLVVSDDGSSTVPVQPGTGLGIPGMHERAAQLGGTLEAGPHGRGWRVELVAPLAVEAPVA